MEEGQSLGVGDLPMEDARSGLGAASGGLGDGVGVPSLQESLLEGNQSDEGRVVSQTDAVGGNHPA